MQITKAVIPVAGLGTRMLPATKAIPKEMLPVVDKPLIQYVVNECVEAGIKEIVLVTHASKNSIENHFDTSFELEATLDKRVKRQLLEEVQSIVPKGVTVIHVRQGVAGGLGHAVMCAYPIVGHAPFAVVLPDVILDDVACNLKKDNLADMVSKFNISRVSQVLVEQVANADVNKFGVVDLEGVDITPGESAKIYGMVEKPDVEDAPSNLAIVGRYVLSENIWDLLKFTSKGAGGEVQLTDAIATLINLEQVDAYYMKGKSHDCGSKLGYLKANVEYALRHNQLGSEYKAYLKSLNL